MAEIKIWKGLNNKTSPERLKAGELSVALDVDIDNTGKLLSRKGRTVVNANPCHSLYSYEAGAFVSQGNSIYAVDLAGGLTLAKTLTTADPVWYTSNSLVAYYTNGTDVGRFVGSTWKSWGIAVPKAQPTAGLSYGSLPPGTYQYALTFRRNDGNESGTGLSGQIALAATGGIIFSGIEVSTNPEVNDKILYLSSPNGEVMYRAAVIPNGQTVAVVSAEANSGIPLMTQFAGPPPAGNMIEIYNGIAFVIAGGTAYYSDSYNFELFRQANNYMQFPGAVAVFAAVDDGIYVATVDTEGDGSTAISGNTYFLKGNRPDKMEATRKFGYGAILGSAVHVEPEYFDSEKDGGIQPRVMWASRQGIIAGPDGGACVNMTEKQYSFPLALSGAGLIRRYRGFVQYMLSLKGTGAADNMYS